MFIVLFLGLVVYMPASVWFIGWVLDTFGAIYGLAAFGLVLFITLVAMFFLLDEL